MKIMNIRTGLTAVLLATTALLLACGGGRRGGETTVTVVQPQETGISVTGNGSVTVTPDVAMLGIGIEVTRTTVAEARNEAAQVMDAVREALADSGIGERDIKTQFFSIYPQYSRPQNGTPEITGYMVSNQLTVTVREIDDVSEVIDQATVAGGDLVRVNDVSFTVDEPEQYLVEAREQAMDDARDRAGQLASLAGMSLGGVRSVSESGGVMPFDSRGGFGGVAMAEAAAATPISPGETEVSLTVFVVYEIE
jgi:uncharacterized protein YggE